MSVTLSLAMIVRDEEALIERVLRCAGPLCDELVVIDTGSRDRTVELALAMGAKVFHFDWIDDFAAARNASFAHCTCDWIMVLDADDVILPEAQQEILRLKREVLSDDFDVVLAQYDYLFDETGRCTASYSRERFFRRAAGLRWREPVHESVDYDPTRARRHETLAIVHQTDESQRDDKRARNMRIIERSMSEGDRSAQTLFYRAIMLFDRGDWAASYEAFREMIELHPTGFFPYDALIRLAYCASQSPQPERALHWARRAIELDPTRAEAFMRIAQYHTDREEFALAIPYAREALTKSRTTSSFLFDRDYTWAPWDLLTVCHAKLGEYHKAMECGLRAISFGTEKERMKSNLLAILERL